MNQHPDAFSPRWPGQWLGLGVVVAIAILAWLPNSYFKMMSWPWALVWQLGFLSLGICLIWMLRRFDVPFNRLGYGLDWGVGLTGLALVISALASSFKLVALWNIVLVACYGLLLYAAVNLLRHSALQRLHLALGMGLFATITAIVSLALWRPTADMWQTNNFDDALRNPLPFGHHNFVGGFFTLALPLAVALAVILKGWQRWIAIAGSLLVGVALYISGSRGAALGCLVWLLVAVAAMVLDPQAKNRRQRLWIGGSVLGAALIAAVSNPRVRDLASSLFQSGGPASAAPDYPALERYFMTRMAANMLRDHPLVGVGLGNLSRVSNIYQPTEFGVGLDHIQQLHNTPAQLIGELGLLGIAVYLGWLILLARLFWQVHRSSVAEPDRILLYGVGGCFLAYSISSLTDYQLENTGISALLMLLLALLVGLRDQAQTECPVPLSRMARRIASLAVLGLLAVMLRLWIAADIGFLLCDRALANTQADNFALASEQWAKAAAIASWDPTYNALSGQSLYALSVSSQGENQQTLEQESLSNFQQALKNAPYDAWFNQNASVLALDTSPAMAEAYARRAVQVLPRTRNFAFYSLGQSLLAQGKTSEAITAFSIEGLMTPRLLIMPLWNEAPYAPLKEAVVAQSLALHNQLLATTPTTSYAFADLYNQSSLVRWWLKQPPLQGHDQLLTPLNRAILQAEQTPQTALETIQQALASDPISKALPLLQAWIDPDQFANAYFQKLGVPEAEAQGARQHLYNNRDIRQWLSSLPGDESIQARSMLGFAYRNWYAQSINLMIQPAGLRSYALVSILELLPDLPRYFPQLDRLVEEVKAAQLGLPSPVNNHFQVTPLPTP